VNVTQFDNLYQLFIVDSVQCVIMIQQLLLLEVCLYVCMSMCLYVCLYICVCQSGKTAVMVAARADYASVVDVIIKHDYLHTLTRHGQQPHDQVTVTVIHLPVAMINRNNSRTTR